MHRHQNTRSRETQQRILYATSILSCIAAVAAVTRDIDFYIILGIVMVGALSAVLWLKRDFLKKQRLLRFASLTLALCLIGAGIAMGLHQLYPWRQKPKLSVFYTAQEQVPDEFAKVLICNFVGDDSKNLRISEHLATAFNGFEIPSSLLRAEVLDRNIAQTDNVTELMREAECSTLVYGDYGLTDASMHIRLYICSKTLRSRAVGGFWVEVHRQGFTRVVPKADVDSYTFQRELAEMILEVGVQNTMNALMVTGRIGQARYLSETFLEAEPSRRVEYPGIYHSLAYSTYLLGGAKRAHSLCTEALDLIVDEAWRPYFHMVHGLAALDLQEFSEAYDSLVMFVNLGGQTDKSMEEPLAHLVEETRHDVFVKVIDSNTLFILEFVRAPIVLHRQPSTGKMVVIEFQNAKDPLLQKDAIYYHVRDYVYEHIIREAKAIVVPEDKDAVLITAELPLRLP